MTVLSFNARRGVVRVHDRFVGSVLQILVLVAVLTGYQLFHLQQDQSYKDKSVRKDRALQQGPLCLSKKSPAPPAVKILENPPPQSFGACLLIMDDNHLLAEWLAYHYQVLPLRRLIVGIDPRSKTQPTEILNRYRNRGLMKITEWQEEDFMPPHLISFHVNVNETNEEELKALYIERQLYFYNKCMAWLKHENLTWTAITDTDEFVLPNPKAGSPYLLQNITNRTIFDLIESNMEIHPMMDNGCISMHRLQFGNKESSSHQVQEGVPRGYNGNDFTTFRWRYHAGFTNKTHNKIAKCMIDASKIHNDWLVSSEVNAHRPIKTMCSETYLRIENRQSPFVAYHYAGSWEQWNFRDDFRPKRKRTGFDMLHFTDDSYQDDSIRPWLNSFIANVGSSLAAELLEGVGQVAPKKRSKETFQKLAANKAFGLTE
jgi:hypothetical protein